MPANAERIPTTKNPIGEASLSLPGFPPTKASLERFLTLPFSAEDSAEAEGDGKKVPLGDFDGEGFDGGGFDGEGFDGEDFDGDGVGVDGVKDRFRLSVKL